MMTNSIKYIILEAFVNMPKGMYKSEQILEKCLKKYPDLAQDTINSVIYTLTTKYNLLDKSGNTYGINNDGIHEVNNFLNNLPYIEYDKENQKKILIIESQKMRKIEEYLSEENNWITVREIYSHLKTHLKDIGDAGHRLYALYRIGRVIRKQECGRYLYKINDSNVPLINYDDLNLCVVSDLTPGFLLENRINCLLNIKSEYLIYSICYDALESLLEKPKPEKIEFSFTKYFAKLENEVNEIKNMKFEDLISH